MWNACRRLIGSFYTSKIYTLKAELPAKRCYHGNIDVLLGPALYSHAMLDLPWDALFIQYGLYRGRKEDIITESVDVSLALGGIGCISSFLVQVHVLCK